MHDASTFVLPASARPWRRPVKQRRGTLRLPSDSTGVWSRGELLASGHTDYSIRKAVQRSRLRRVAPGWYARAGALPKVTRPLAADHRLTCISATRMHGLWTPFGDSAPGADPSDPHRLHVYGSRRVKTPPRMMGAAHPYCHAWPERDAVASLPLALEHAMRCQSGETAAILLDSAMERRLLNPAEVRQLLGRAPVAVRSRIGPLSIASEPGSETRVVRWLRRRGFQVEQQVYIDGAGFVDAYAGGIFLEVDGRDPHDGEDAFLRDRERDMTTTSHGLQVLRISYEQTWFTWETTKEKILSSISEAGAFGRRKVDKLLMQ